MVIRDLAGVRDNGPLEVARTAPAKAGNEDPKTPRDIRDVRTPRRRLAKQAVPHDQLALFQDEELSANGEISIKTSYLAPSKKYWVELRRSTMVVFKDRKVPNAATMRSKDVISIINVREVEIDMVQKGQHCDIYFTGEGCSGVRSPVVKVRSQDDFERWQNALQSAMVDSIPRFQDLIVDTIIGMGGGGKVFLTVLRPTGGTYALKVISKKQAFRSASSLRSVVNERRLMAYMMPHPFILEFLFSFQTDSNFYVGTPFCKHGDLATWVNKQPGRRVGELKLRLIAAEILLGIQHLHRCGIVYRDLKPENIFIADDGHIKIGDFGLAKSLRVSYANGVRNFRTTSVCGTRDYLPPEMISRKQYGFEVDMWTFGVTMYRLLTGILPFRGDDTSDVFDSIKHGRFYIPDYFSETTRHLLKSLLRLNHSARITLLQVKQHPYFDGISWNDVLNKRYGPVLRNLPPVHTKAELMQNFDRRRLSKLTVGEYPIDDDDATLIKGSVGLGAKLPGFDYCALEEKFEQKGRLNRINMSPTKISINSLRLTKVESGNTESGD